MTRKQVAKVINGQRAIQLDVGCGGKKQQGFVGMDKRKVPGVDIVHDLEVTPWPLPDNICSVVVLSHVWEHIMPNKTLDVMAEIHRVCRPNAIVMISGPYGMGFRYQADPTHCNPTNTVTFRYFDPFDGRYGIYEPPPLHLEHFVIVPAPPGDRDFEAALRVCKGKCTHKGGNHG
jgi:SAM-dependent methyltransferase